MATCIPNVALLTAAKDSIAVLWRKDGEEINLVSNACNRKLKTFSNFNGWLTVHPDIIKVLFANLMHNFFIKSIVFLYMFRALLSSPNLCAERSPKESDDIRCQVMHIYN